MSFLVSVHRAGAACRRKAWAPQDVFSSGSGAALSPVASRKMGGLSDAGSRHGALVSRALDRLTASAPREDRSSDGLVAKQNIVVPLVCCLRESAWPVRGSGPWVFWQIASKWATHMRTVAKYGLLACLSTHIGLDAWRAETDFVAALPVLPVPERPNSVAFELLQNCDFARSMNNMSCRQSVEPMCLLELSSFFASRPNPEGVGWVAYGWWLWASVCVGVWMWGSPTPGP